MDQSSTTRKPSNTSYIGEGRLKSGRCVILPGSHRPSIGNLATVSHQASPGQRSNNNSRVDRVNCTN
jgi:hypothetical protein